MSPRPADDFDESVDMAPPVKKGKPQIVPQGQIGAGEVDLPEETLRPGMPIIRARVVYLGPGENHAVSFGGQIAEQYLEDVDGTVTRKDRDGQERKYTVLKTATDAGITQYDFSIRDALGHMIPTRMMPRDAPTKLAGRPFTWCEHMGHLRRFFLAKDERGEKLYHIRATDASHVALLQENIRRSERARKANEQLFSDITTR